MFGTPQQDHLEGVEPSHLCAHLDVDWDGIRDMPKSKELDSIEVEGSAMGVPCTSTWTRVSSLLIDMAYPTAPGSSTIQPTWMLLIVSMVSG